MRFAISAAILALVSSVLAQTTDGFDVISAPSKDQEVPAGTTFDIVWAPSTKFTGTVTIGLLGGSSPSTLQTLSTIKSGVASSAGKFTWAVDSTLGTDSTYGIQITLDSDKTVFQYSFPFHIKASSSSTNSSSTSVTSTSKGAAKTTYTTPSSNLSTTATSHPTKVTITSTATGGGSKTTNTGSTVPTNGAEAVAAGSFALLGGLAIAAFAL